MKKAFPAPHRQATDSPGFLLWAISNDWRREQSAALDPLGLTHVQFVLLASILWLSLNEPDEPITQARLARHARTDVMMTSQVARALADRRLLERVPHPTDTRAKCLALTSKGEELVRRAFPLVERVNREFFGPLGGRYGGFVEAMQQLLLPNAKVGEHAV